MALRMLAGLLLLAAAPTSRAGTLYEASEGFSLDIPEGWVQIPQVEVDKAARRMAAEGAPANLRVVSAFGKQNARPFEYPYVMVQLIPYPGSNPPNESEMGEMVRQISGAALNEARRRAGGGKYKSATVFEPDFDPYAKKYTIPLDMKVPGIGTIRGKMSGYFGKKYLIQVCCYDRADRFETSEVRFNAILASFNWAEHAKIPPPAVGDKTLVIGLGVGAAAVLVVMFLSGFKKSREDRALGHVSPPPPPPPPPPPVRLVPATREEAPWR